MLAFLAVSALLAAGSGAAAFLGFWSPFVWQVGMPIEQPVPFSHQHHVGGLGIDCRYCHTGVETGRFAGMPSTETCMTCHSQEWRDAPMLEPVRASWREGKSLLWFPALRHRLRCFRHLAHRQCRHVGEAVYDRDHELTSRFSAVVVGHVSPNFLGYFDLPRYVRIILHAALFIRARAADGGDHRTAQRARGGCDVLDAYSPFDVEGLAEALGIRWAVVPLITLLGGIGGSFRLGGGRPLLSWAAFVPITFEMTILGACLSAIFGMLAINRLPQPHHPIFDTPHYAERSATRFYLCMEAKDAHFDLEKTRGFLFELAPQEIWEVLT